MKIIIEDGTLTITGQRKFEQNDKKDRPLALACGRFVHLAIITCLSALPLITGLTGCAAARGHQSTGHFEDLRAAERSDNQITDQRMEDSRTAERVREALTTGVDYKYDGVIVLAAEGVVELSGFVNTSAQRNRAGEVTSKVLGVKNVENKLSLKD